MTTPNRDSQFRHLVQGVTDYAIYMLDPAGIVTNWNAGAARTKGYAAEEIVGQHFSRFFTPEDRALGLPAKALATALETGRFESEGWRLRKDGTRFWAHVVIDLIRDEAGAFIGFAKITRDVTSRKQDADRLQRATKTLDLALSNMKHGLCMFDPHEVLQLANTRFVEMFQTPDVSALIGLTLAQVMDLVLRGRPQPGPPPATAELVYHRHRQLVRTGSDRTIIEALSSGRAIAIAHSPLPDGAWVSTFEDVTESQKARDTIAQLASQDSLTGLANRRAFDVGIAAILGSPQSRGKAVMLIDLNDFKAVNDRHGHAAGDQVLLHVADSIRGCIRAGDVAARIGGDEFAVVLADCQEPEAIGVAERLIHRVQAPTPIGPGTTVTITVSIGVVMAAAADSEPEPLLNHADLALYDAKATGKAGFRLYAHEMGAKLRLRRTLEHDLRDAVHTGAGLQLLYQPWFDPETGQCLGREALLHWTHPRHGTTPPTLLMPLAEQLGLARDLGRITLHQACADAAHWPGTTRLGLTLFPSQLGTGQLPGQLPGQLQAALAASGLPAHRLHLAITEPALAHDRPGKLAGLHQLHDIGADITLDGFGANASSLGILRAFPFDRIKLDAALLRDALLHPESEAILGAIASLGERLGITVAATGIETHAHLALARNHGCPEVQGPLLGHPAPDPSYAETLPEAAAA